MAANNDKAIAVADPFARHLMAQYVRRRERDPEILSAALGGSDFEAIKLIGHKLFGSGAAYGLHEVTRLGGELERAAEAQDAEKIRVLIAELERYVQQLKLP